MTVQYPEIERHRSLTRQDFYNDFVDKKPVVIEGAISDWPALSRWTPDYFRTVAKDLKIKVKPGNMTKGNVEFLPMGDYLDLISEYEEKLANGQTTPEDRPAYLHDIPMLEVRRQLVNDVTPFPTFYLPKWYQSQWWKFSQFFYGPSHSLTPMHFDSLETHNIFFQIIGKKRFIIARPEARKYSYMFKWRWSAVDAENPDFDRHPEFRKVSPMETTVGPGDILYMPPGTLHQVRGLDQTVSFNIDWQTAYTALRGVSRISRGMPLKNVYYNAVAAVGLCTHIPSRVLFPLYKSYLSYVS